MATSGAPGGAPLLRRALGLASRALDLVLPPRCAGCRREGSYLCAVCLGQARRLSGMYRPATGGSIGAEMLVIPIALDGVYAPFAMEGAVREAVHRLKYRSVRAIATVLGQEMAACAQQHGITPDVLAPVPLHRRRLLQRGYNQAALLAREVGSRLGAPVDAQALVRASHAGPQARTASRRQRWTQVQGAYRARRDMQGQRVLLIDDVCTTGATLNACAAALKAAGAAEVWGLTAAREV